MDKAAIKQPVASVPTKRKKSRKSQKPAEAPKRFKSSFIFFSSAKHKEIRQKLAQKGSTEKVTDVAKIVSQQWKSLPPEERETWDELARKDKERYEAEKKTYKGPWKIASEESYKKDPNAPKRPMSAFFAWSNKKRASMKKKQPNLKNSDISKLLSVAWKNAPPDEKQIYIDEEFESRKQYKVLLASWNKKKQEENRKKLREEALNKKRAAQQEKTAAAAEERSLQVAKENSQREAQVASWSNADAAIDLVSMLNSSHNSGNQNDGLSQAVVQEAPQNQQQQLLQNALTLSSLGGQNATTNQLMSTAGITGGLTTQPFAMLPQTQMLNMAGGLLPGFGGQQTMLIPPVQTTALPTGQKVVGALPQLDALQTQQLQTQQFLLQQQQQQQLLLQLQQLQQQQQQQQQQNQLPGYQDNNAM